MRLATLTSATVFALALSVMNAPSAQAATGFSVSTTAGRSCTVQVDAYRGSYTVAIPAVYFRPQAWCSMTVALIYGGATLYEQGPTGTFQADTESHECESPCTSMFFPYHAYYPALPAGAFTYYATGGVGVDLISGGSEKFVTPSPVGCSVFNNGYSLWCSGMRDYA